MQIAITGIIAGVLIFLAFLSAYTMLYLREIRRSREYIGVHPPEKIVFILRKVLFATVFVMVAGILYLLWQVVFNFIS